MIFICLFSALVVFTIISGPTGSFERRHLDPFQITNLEFIDGGSEKDTIVATTKNTTNETLTVTSGQVTQYYWVDNGTAYQNPIQGHEQAVGLFGDLTIPINGTKNIHLSLPTDTLILGKTYSVKLVADNHIQQNCVDLISGRERFIFYHMYHPDASGPVEEGIITFLLPGGHHYSNSGEVNGDVMMTLVQNTGDFPITIMGGFVNGAAAIKTADAMGVEQCVIEKNETKNVFLNFPAKSLPDQEQNNTRLNVKLVTAKGNTIEYADEFYYALSFYDIQQPVVVKEQAVITSVKFSDGDMSRGTVLVTVENSGSNPINISGSLLNGKATVILSNQAIIGVGSTQTFTIQAGTLVQGNKYQVVLISSQNNPFIYASTFS
jgi:hypothetical protein